jgi:hypothetical protein
MRQIVRVSLVVLLFFSGIAASVGQTSREERKADRIEDNLKDFGPFFPDFGHLGEFAPDSVRVFREEQRIQLFFNREVSHIPLREQLIAEEECRIKSFLGWHYRKYHIELLAGSTPLTELVPNFYRNLLPIDSSHFPVHGSDQRILYTRPERTAYPAGLYGKHIALWPSHGRYYEASLDRWEWQRARLHTTVEDLLPMSFVLPYLTRILENAGAITLMPRERDIQRHEVIIDNDLSTQNSQLELNLDRFSFEKIPGRGFRWQKTYLGEENPFRLGSYLIARAKTYPDRPDCNWVARYVPDIPAAGSYALYISYGQNETLLTPVAYRIQTPEGIDRVLVDQRMGAGTWIYLGQYFFEAGKNPKKGAIEVISMDPASLITLDAIRIGGGMGNIARQPDSLTLAKRIRLETQKRRANATKPGSYPVSWRTSGLPRYMEAARYYLQYAGVPAEIYKLNPGTDDYRDDYQCRGEWVNYLMGNTGATDSKNISGPGIPIDLALAFHTDAGIAGNDSIIGTLAIYSNRNHAETFPDGRSRGINRELADIVQSEIVRDILQTHNPEWTRRGLWNKAYSEAYRANTPSLLLELLSHQNLADMRYALDPGFRFMVSRAIYKGILRFLAFQDRRSYTVQPLPPDHFGIEKLPGKRVRLSWQPVTDTLEPTAIADHFHIYVREQASGFRLLENHYDSTVFTWELPEYGKIYSFRVVAANAGGESFPSEILSAGVLEGTDSTALVVNAFDRTGPPAIIDRNDFAGVAFWEDEGVPDRQDLSTVGMPYDYERNSPWLDDDSPGWGASHSDREGRIVPGNTFDFTGVHGRAILANGLSFVSCSDEFFTTNRLSDDLTLIDVFYGEERTQLNPTTNLARYRLFPEGMQHQLLVAAEKGIPFLISGAYLGTDMMEQADTQAIRFAQDHLHFQWRSGHADRMGMVYGTDDSSFFSNASLSFNTGYHPMYYTVEAPDALEPCGDQSVTILRYRSSRASAAVAAKGRNRTVVLGFPFETILSASVRNEFMGKVVAFLLEKG